MKQPQHVRAVRQRVAGTLLVENGRSALILHNPQPDPETADSLTLRFAFVTRGREEHIFPAFLIDDWGREIRGLKLYRWVKEHGEQFPRGEIFGFERDGAQTQLFLRELELYAKLPCYAYPSPETPLAEGRLLHAVLLPTPGVTAVQRCQRPSDLDHPLRAARVTWRQIPPDMADFDFSLLDAPPDPGY